LLEAARRNGVRKIIIASSSSVYGVNSKVHLPKATQSSAPFPLRRQQAGLRGARPCLPPCLWPGRRHAAALYCLWPRQRPDLAIHKFARLISAGAPISVFGDGSAARDYTYISDTLEGVLACTQKEFGFEIFNLGESNPCDLID